MYAVVWEWDGTWTLVKGATRLAKVLEPFVVATEEHGKSGKVRTKLAKAVIRAQLENTALSLFNYGSTNRHMTEVGTRLPSAALFNLVEGEYPEEGRERPRHGRLIDRVNAVYWLHAATE